MIEVNGVKCWALIDTGSVPGKKWVTYYVQVSTSFLKICTYL